jgi:hypothetical protein
MKNKYWLGAAIIAMIALSGCKDGTKLVTYTFGGKDYSVTIGDIRSDLTQYLVYDTSFVSDAERQKEYVFQQKVLPDLVYFYQLQKGFTNSAAFISNYANIDEQTRLYTLYDSGKTILSNDLAKSKFEVVRASHILIRVNTTTNINGTTVTLDSNQIAQLWADKLAVANNILDFLKSSRQLDKDFAQAVSDYSDDLGSKMNGGDLDYFTRGRMVPEFENAIFDFGKKGLIPEVIKTQYGYHIIFVTVAPSKKTMPQIMELVDQQMSYYVQNSIVNSYYMQLEASNVVTHYEATLTGSVSSNEGSSVDGVFYMPNEIPNEALMIEIFGQKYTWADCKKVIELFIPTFATNTSTPEFISQMMQFKNFMFLVSRAEAAKVEGTAAFKKKFEEMKKSQMIQAAFGLLANDWYTQADSMATLSELTNYYEKMKAMGMTVTNVLKADGTFESRQMTYTQMSNQVREEFIRNRQYEIFDSWRAQVMTQFSVTYNEAGFTTLKEVLQKDLDDFLKSEEGQAMQQQMMQQQMMQMMQQQGGQIRQ